MPATQGFVPDRKRVRQLEMIYAASEKVLQVLVFSINLVNYTIPLANKIRRNSQEEIQKLNLKAMQWSRIAIPESYNISKRLGTSKLQNAGMSERKNFNNEIHQKSIDVGIAATQRVLLRANRSIMLQINLFLSMLGNARRQILRANIQELGEEDRVVVNKIIERGLERELTLNQISDKVLNHFRLQFGAGQFINRNGRNYSMKYYSEMVARTQMRLLQSKATKNVAREYGNDLVIWSDHFLRVQDECAIYAGRIFSLSGKSKDHPPLTEEPPIHPQCEHYLDPYPDILESFV